MSTLWRNITRSRAMTSCRRLLCTDSLSSGTSSLSSGLKPLVLPEVPTSPKMKRKLTKTDIIALKDPTRPVVIQRPPITPCMRHTALIDYSAIFKGRPIKALTTGKTRIDGRNNQGRITVRHRGGGHKRLYRFIDFKRRLFADIPGTIKRIEYDPNRNAFIALVKHDWDPYKPIPEQFKEIAAQTNGECLLERHVKVRPKVEMNAASEENTESEANSSDTVDAEANSSMNEENNVPPKLEKRVKIPAKAGQYTYIICPQGVRVGSRVISSKRGAVELQPGNAALLRHIPIGTRIYNVELHPGRGGVLARAAGTSAQLLEKNEKKGLALIRQQSKEIRYVPLSCMASIGEVSNPNKKNESLGKAGRNRWKGWRPKVRGVAMNPIDHPHGGGEGKTGPGRPSCSPWGKPTKGYRTRRKGNPLVVKRVFQVKMAKRKK